MQMRCFLLMPLPNMQNIRTSPNKQLGSSPPPEASTNLHNKEQAKKTFPNFPQSCFFSSLQYLGKL